MNLLVLLLVGCTPNDAEISNAGYTIWLAENSSATVSEGDLDLSGATYMDCTGDQDSGMVEGVDYRCPAEAAGGTGGIGGIGGDTGDAGITLDQAGPNFWMDDDAYYLLEDDIVDPYRTEALITSEGDFQLTVHHDLGDGQDFRFAFVVAPQFQPSICIQEDQTCYNSEDDDGDGLVDYDDPDCLFGSWEVGFDRYACNDGIDNDGDGLVDIDDSDCDHPFDDQEGGATESCSDGQDNDGDSWVDEADPDCDGLGAEEDGATNGFSACNDGIDNDGDGLTDSDDVASDYDGGCVSAWDNDEGGFLSYDPCTDRVDNDGDGWVDDQDSDCIRYLDEVGWRPLACNDGIDNDGDGFVDADDDGCVSDADHSEASEDGSCSDGSDNDSDGWIDADDPDCLLGEAEDATYTYPCSDGAGDDSACSSGFATVVDGGSCSSGEDGDGDGWIDDADPDCSYFPYGQQLGYSQLACNDGIDNDSDGLVDADDADCLSALQGTEAAISADCADDVDNDGDGWFDFEDADCLFDGAEGGATNASIECADGIDNDGNGLIDREDLDNCDSGTDSYERSTWSCEDGIDNDGDGWVDNAEDPDCAEYAYEFAFVSGQCTDGVDNDGDGDIDRDDESCLGSTSPWEVADQCADGLDNDGDGWFDGDDPGCVSTDTPYENDGLISTYACNDSQDNDGDGYIDSFDPECTYAWDNIEDTEEGGDPVPFPLDYGWVLDEWSADEEDGTTIYYLNAGAYQVDPSSEGSAIWVLPQEWRAGYAHAKFAAEEFDSQPTLYGDAVTDADDFETSYVGESYNDPDPDRFDRNLEKWQENALAWTKELTDYGMMSWDGFELKIEDNSWRPIDISSAGLDNWIELNTSWVRITTPREDMKVGGKVAGDFQIYFVGRESSSAMVVRGSFETTNIREDIWGYEVLEAEKFDENGNVNCEFQQY